MDYIDKSDIIVGGYYVCEMPEQSQWDSIFQCSAKSDDGMRIHLTHRLYCNGSMYEHHPGVHANDYSWSSDYGTRFRFATSDEIEWYLNCVAAKKLVPKPIRSELNYSIY